jgi:hypothetical protein
MNLIQYWKNRLFPKKDLTVNTNTDKLPRSNNTYILEAKLEMVFGEKHFIFHSENSPTFTIKTRSKNKGTYHYSQLKDLDNLIDSLVKQKGE